MKRLRDLGTVLVAAGLLFAIVRAIFLHAEQGYLAAIVMVAFPLAFFPGIIALAISGCYRLSRGQVKFRIFPAARTAPFIWAAVMACRYVISLIVPTAEFHLVEATIQATTVAVVQALYTTAYRRPA